MTKVFCAIDTHDLERAKLIAKEVGPITGGLKLGLEFIYSCGLTGIEKIISACPGATLFLDLKLHDIPNTVARATEVITNRFQPAYLNLHAGAGLTVMKAAKDSCHPSTKLLGVTVLTSLNYDELNAIGFEGDSVMTSVKRLAALCAEAGLDGVVCSAEELQNLKGQFSRDFVYMVPGIRPTGSNLQDQKRVMTPEQALQAGATHLVIGRPITQADDPAQAAESIMAGIGNV